VKKMCWRELAGITQRGDTKRQAGDNGLTQCKYATLGVGCGGKDPSRNTEQRGEKEV